MRCLRKKCCKLFLGKPVFLCLKKALPLKRFRLNKGSYILSMIHIEVRPRSPFHRSDAYCVSHWINTKSNCSGYRRDLTVLLSVCCHAPHHTTLQGYQEPVYVSPQTPVIQKSISAKPTQSDRNTEAYFPISNFALRDSPERDEGRTLLCWLWQSLWKDWHWQSRENST